MLHYTVCTQAIVAATGWSDRRSDRLWWQLPRVYTPRVYTTDNLSLWPSPVGCSIKPV